MIGLLTITLIIFLLPTVIYVTSDEKTIGRLAYFFRSTLLGFICLALVFINAEQYASNEDFFNILKAPENNAFLGGSWVILFVLVFTVFSDNNLGRLRQPPWPVDLIIKKGVPV
ncbi:hypothetical protein [Kiloniella sp.]|uniref:hypothetical protein n=1 Tax=Kiloniella sp. TaxID=1938587 RepID=UPI003B0261F2